MSRWVEAQRAGLTSSGSSSDAAVKSAKAESAAERIVKYVPAEIVAVFTMAFSVMPSMNLADAQRPKVMVGLILFFLVVTIAYVARKAPKGQRRTAHLLVSPLAFLAWAYPIGSSQLGPWFIGLVAFGLQVGVIGASLFVAPSEG